MIFRFIDYNLGILRLINIIFITLSSLVLGYGVKNYIDKVLIKNSSENINFFAIFCAIILFQIPSLWIERVPAYNNIASFCNLSITGFLLFSISGMKSKIIPFIMGFLLCFSTIVKPPSGILMTVFIVTFILINKHNQRSFISILLGISFFASIHFVFIESPIEFYNVTKNGFLHYSYFDVASRTSIFRYANQILGNIIFSLLANKYELLFVILTSIYFIKYRLNNLFYIFILISFIFISFKHYLFGDLKGGMGLYWSLWRLYIAQFIVVTAILISFMICKRVNLKDFFINKKFLTSLCIILSPILFAFGTNNLITFNMNFYTSLFFIGVLFLLLLILQQTKISLSSIHILFFLTLASICPSYAYLHGRLLCNSYTISEPSAGNIFKNSEMISVHGCKLKVTDSVNKITHSLRTELMGYKNDLKYLLNLSHMYGLNFLCDLPHPIQPWTGNMKNNFTLENIDFDIFQSSAILYRTNDQQVFEQLSKSFPEWKISHPNSKIISYNIKNKESSLTLLLPNNE